MCGRYVRSADKQRIAETLRAKNDVSSLAMPPHDYNIAPSTFQPVIRESRENSDRELVLVRWGLIPFFTKQLSDVKGVSTINARAESVQKSPTWREPLKKRRCLVPVNAFYEWKRLDAKTKQPFAFTVSDQPLFAFHDRPPRQVGWILHLGCRLSLWNTSSSVSPIIRLWAPENGQG